MTPFRLSGLDPATFLDLFERDDETLARSNIRRVCATAAFGYPCRVSMEDAAVGEELLLLPFQHLPQASPYQASGPIFVRRGVAQAILAPGEIPPYVARRLMSLLLMSLRLLLLRPRRHMSLHLLLLHLL